MTPTYFEPRSLWNTLVRRTQSAISHGALHSIDTAAETIEQTGAHFVVRVAKNLRRKQEDRKRPVNTRKESGSDYDPFLPPEPDLTVADINATHRAVLNKFNVVDHHLLIVTREFEHQDSLLTLNDFEALWLCLNEYPSLGFYNGGTLAGASQTHKHLQLVPLPLYAGDRQFPLQTLFNTTSPSSNLVALDGFPFMHAFCRLPGRIQSSPSNAASHCLTLYRRMLESTGIDVLEKGSLEYHSTPYNLLVTHEWMLLAPRSAEFSHGISINGLGYVGSLFVMDHAGLETIRNVGPMTILKQVSMDWE